VAEAEGRRGAELAAQDLVRAQEDGLRHQRGLHRHWDHNVPQDRAQHLLLDVATGRITDLFEGTAHERVHSGTRRSCRGREKASSMPGLNWPLQAGRDAAVHVQDVAVDEAGGARRQEDDRAAQVFSRGSI
jgi:hypothetical protein